MTKVKEAVILASGMGTRIFKITKGKPKFLLLIENKPIITYPIKVLKIIGINKINIVIPKGWINSLEEITRELPIDVCIAENEEIDRENGYSLLLSRKCLTSNKFILTMCDHIYEPKLVEKIITSHEKNLDIVVGGDSDPKFIDIDEATRICADKDLNLIDIGKGLPKYNYVDVGVFLMTIRVFEVLSELAKKQHVIKLSDVLKEAVHRGLHVKVADVTGYLWTEVDNEKDYMELIRGNRRVVLERVLSYIG